PATFVPFSAQTRMSRGDLDGRQVRKGALEGITRFCERRGHAIPSERQVCVGESSNAGGTPLLVSENGRAPRATALPALARVGMDSNPHKHIEIVEIGKQLLITRGALTTFSVANDVAKYFAIIPAMFAAAFPQLEVLNIMRLRTPESAILSAVIFNALIIIAL